MGYTTDFEGAFQLDPPLEPEHLAYLRRFSHTRRMKRHAELLEDRPDPERLAAGLPNGVEGAYYVGSPAPFGQDWDDPSVSESNTPPGDQPGLWCRWTPSSSR